MLVVQGGRSRLDVAMELMQNKDTVGMFYVNGILPIPSDYYYDREYIKQSLSECFLDFLYQIKNGITYYKFLIVYTDLSKEDIEIIDYETILAEKDFPHVYDVILFCR